MQNVELRLLAKVIRTNDFRALIKAKITPDMFETYEAKALYETLWQHYTNPATAGELPSPEFINSRHPKIILDFKAKKNTKVRTLCEELRREAMIRKLRDLHEEVGEIIDRDPMEALNRLRTGAHLIQTMTATSRDVLLSEAFDEIKREYETIRSQGGVVGIPYPWKELTRATGGMLPEELIILYGRLKSMKTFVGCWVAADAYFRQNRRVLFYSAELSPKVVAKRIAAAICRIDYGAMKRGELTKRERRDLFDMLETLAKDEEAMGRGQHRPALLITSDKDGGGMGGVSHIHAKAEEFEPDLIIVDSYYRLRDDRTGKHDYDWRAQSNIVQDLKHLAQQRQIPVIGISQANRASKEREMNSGMEDSSYADATGQEADLGIRIVLGEKNSNGTQYITGIIAAAREFEAYGFVLEVQPFHKFSWKGWIQKPTSSEIVTVNGQDFRLDDDQEEEEEEEEEDDIERRPVRKKMTKEEVKQHRKRRSETAQRLSKKTVQDSVKSIRELMSR
jgi:replicative DNA helicase